MLMIYFSFNVTFSKNSKSGLCLLQYPLRRYRKFYTTVRTTFRFRPCENFERAFWKVRSNRPGENFTDFYLLLFNSKLVNVGNKKFKKYPRPPLKIF